MNKFASVLLSACVLSGSASWGMCQAVGNFVKNNPVRCCQAALLVGAPLALGCADYVNALKESAETKKLAEKVANKNEEHKEVAQKCIADLECRETALKKHDIMSSSVVGCTSAVLSSFFGIKDPVDIAGIAVGSAVLNLMRKSHDLSHAACMHSWMLPNE